MKKQNDINSISSIINVRNYMITQMENPRLERAVVNKYHKYVTEIDKMMAEHILKYFDDFLGKEENKNEGNEQ